MLDDDSYTRWVINTSQGLTAVGLKKLSESIRIYARLILGSQVQGKASILGVNSEAFTIQQLFQQEFEKLCKRPESIQDDIQTFQSLLKYARTAVNFVVVPGAYMIPSNMMLQIGKLVDYNNNILIAPNHVKVGEITSLNEKADIHQAADIHRVAHDPFQGKRYTLVEPTSQEHKLPPHEIHQAKQHEEEKQALIIGGVSLIIFGFYLFR